MTDPSHYLFWMTSRAAGTTAMVLACTPDFVSESLCVFVNKNVFR